jgi:hypothetical protein
MMEERTLTVRGKEFYRRSGSGMEREKGRGAIVGQCRSEMGNRKEIGGERLA